MKKSDYSTPAFETDKLLFIIKSDIDILFINIFSNGQYIVAGSDDGSFYIWERATTNIVRVLRGDDSIVNCLQPNPTQCLLATSGIDPVVRLWSPKAEVIISYIVLSFGVPSI